MKTLIEVFDAASIKTAKLETSDGRLIDIAILEVERMNIPSWVELQRTLKQLQLENCEPDVICLARSIGLWARKLTVSKEKHFNANHVYSIESKPRSMSMLRRGENHKESLIFVAGEDLYTNVADKTTFDGNIYTIDNSFKFIKIKNTFSESDLYNFFSFDAFVEEYIRSIEAAQINTSIIIAGFSYGGMLSLAIAKKLTERGYKIATVILIDTLTPEGIRSIRFWKRLLSHAFMIQRNGFSHIIATVRNIRRRALSRREAGHSVAWLSSNEFSDSDMVRMFEPNVRYDGEAVLIKSNNKMPYTPAGKDYGWARTVPNLRVVEFPGDHDEFMYNKSDITADLISKILQDTLV